MKCLSPLKYYRVVEGVPFPREHRCGQCMPCRLTRRQEWTLRLILEHKLSDSNALWATLTYSDPPRTADGHMTLVKKDLQDHIKRLRSRLSPRTFRFYGVGEYGEEYGRPHYHVAYFGLTPDDASDIEESWTSPNEGRGFVQVDFLNPERAAYMAGYTVKKMTNVKQFPPGVQPEFSRMSTKPGIGCDFRDTFVKTLSNFGLKFVDKDGALDKGQLPNHMRYKGTIYHIDPYLRTKILEAMGYEKNPDKFKRELENVNDLMQRWSDRDEQAEEKALRVAKAAARRYSRKKRTTF